MSTNAKTRKVAVYPDGTRYPLHRANGAWWWRYDRASSHLDGVRDNLAAEYGGWIEIEPNPYYRPETPWTTLDRIFAGKR